MPAGRSLLSREKSLRRCSVRPSTCMLIPRTKITRSHWRRAACWWTVDANRGAYGCGPASRDSSIAQTLERQFNVDIVIADERLRKICFTGEFVDGENIHEIMRIISADSRILYRNRKNRFELYRNR